MRTKIFKPAMPGRQTENKSMAVGRIWPNGEFSVGYVPVLEDADEREYSYSPYQMPLVSPDDDDWYFDQLELWEEGEDAADSMHGLPCSVPLTLSNASDSHSPPPRAKQGLKGLTAKGRKMIRSGAFLLEQRLGKDDCVMITLTVPTLGLDARRAVAKQWGSLTNRLVQYLSRELLKQGRKPTIIGCVEVQTARLKKYSEGYLHLHLIAPAHGNKGRTWAVDTKELVSWWKRALERVINTTLPQAPRVETAIVEKSVEAYLSKYLSKGGTDELDAFVADLGEDCVPGQWWFCSAPMRQAIEENTLYGPNVGALLESVIEHLLEQGTGEGFEYVRHVDRKIGQSLVTCGWVGRLTPEFYVDLRQFLDCPF